MYYQLKVWTAGSHVALWPRAAACRPLPTGWSAAVSSAAPLSLMVGVPAALLVGPTGAGKTPFGEFTEQHGFCGRPCKHFDFGERLRAVVASDDGLGLSPTEIRTVRNVLEAGALLEDSDIGIIRGILEAFIKQHDVGGDSGTVLLLNGMPRHAGQAAQIADLVSIEVVVSLDCSDATVRARIAADSGGDRAERMDDADELVSKKLETFRQRTRPLLDHYALASGAAVVAVEVHVDTQPADIQRVVDAAPMVKQRWGAQQQPPPPPPQPPPQQQQTAAVHPPTLGDEELQQFARDGFLRLGQVGDSLHVAALQDRIDAIMLGEVTVPNMMMQLCPSASDLPQFAVRYTYPTVYCVPPEPASIAFPKKD